MPENPEFSRGVARLLSQYRRCADTFYLLTSWGFAAMAAITAYEVFMRYVLRQPTIWVTELTTLICAALFLISGPFVMRRDEHLSITILSDVAPRWLKRVFAVVKYLVILVFCTGLSLFSFESGWEPLSKWERAGTQWNPPTSALIKPLIVVVAIIMAMQATINLVRHLRAPDAATRPSSF